MMQGSAAAKRLVNNYLAHDLPERLTTYRNHWHLDEDSLPDPLLYLTYEPVALDTWPTIITVAISTPQIGRVDYDSSLNPEYHVRYTMRTYVWVKADGSEYCTEIRDNITTVLRSALLDHASLRTADYTDCGARVEESNLREEFSDLTLIKGDRVMAGAYIGYDLTLTEHITRRNVGELGSVEIETEILEDPLSW